MDHLNSFAKAAKEFLLVLQADAGYTVELLKEVADRLFLALKRFQRGLAAEEDFLLVRCMVPAIDPSLTSHAKRD